MPKYFQTFSELVNWRKSCPICGNDLIYQVKTYIDKSLDIVFADKLKSRFEIKVSKAWAETKGEIIKTDFKSSDMQNIEFKIDDLTINFNSNEGLANSINSFFNDFYIHISCEHEIIGKAYEAAGYFNFDFDYIDENLIPIKNDKIYLPISNISIHNEIFKIINVKLEDEKPNGNLIKIINDFRINKTSFSLAESNLDGSWGTWKEKRINLVDDNFFKFNSSEKVYSRINTIFLLK